jgi:hypothetical protein
VSGRVVRLGGDVHQKVQALLPWYVHASLDAEELAHVEAHLAECPRCQAELAWERKVQATCPNQDADAPGAVDHVDQEFAQLRQRIAGSKAPHRRYGLMARLKLRWYQAPAWTRLFMLGQCVLVATLSSGLLLVSQAPDHRFRALGEPAATSASAESGNLIVRFRPEATEQEMRRVLRDSKARLVNGPTTTDAYVLAVPDGPQGEAVNRLRKEPSVLLVESLDGRAAP